MGLFTQVVGGLYLLLGVMMAITDLNNHGSLRVLAMDEVANAIIGGVILIALGEICSRTARRASDPKSPGEVHP